MTKKHAVDVDELNAWLKAIEDNDIQAEDASDLSEIGDALDAIDAAEAALVAAVRRSRERNRSWTDIGNVLGVSRQAARQRFAAAVGEKPLAAPAKRGPAKKVVAKKATARKSAAVKISAMKTSSLTSVPRVEQTAAGSALNAPGKVTRKPEAKKTPR